MAEQFLYKKLENAKEFGASADLPEIIKSGLSKRISLREYQIEAFTNFVLYFENDRLKQNSQVHTLFHMATGSGKTVIMAGLILYLYTKGYRKFIFFVNQTNVLEKTIDNFINQQSNKYLFNDVIEYLGKKVRIKEVANFSGSVSDDVIEILFTTTQKLHSDLSEVKENSLTYDDFEDNKVVFISDESHHVNSLTKKSTNKSKEEKDAKSWEYSVTNAFRCNKQNIMLEFTATCDLKDKNVTQKYKDKIVFNYPLVSFRKSGYTKDFQNIATDTDAWTRTLIALIMSEYRRFLFADLKLNIKPVIMLKSRVIGESKRFYAQFFKKIKELTTNELRNLELVEIDRLTEAINYFKEKDDTLELLEQSIKTSFTEATSIIMNGESDNNKANRLLVNSLEDLDNPIRIIFAVEMLNEGWDVLNLFDIVRLYDTRQNESYTIKEAQLIGRGARYCPFVVDDVELKFKRKYDEDVSNPNRLLETMYFHSRNDSRYISELKNALIEIGLESIDQTTVEYKLKDEFKESDFYKKCFVFSNKRLPKRPEDRQSIEPCIRTKTYYYTAPSGKGNIINLIEQENTASTNPFTSNSRFLTLSFNKISYNILLGAAECFEELRFDILKEKYPSLKSMREFLTSDDYLGNSKIEISYSQDEISGKIIFLAVKQALIEVVSYVKSVKFEYVGSKEFEPKPLKEVIKNKSINITLSKDKGGRGNSQNTCLDDEYRIDLSNESWYVFNDNYGTSEEKLFIKHFKSFIEPKLKKKNLEYYVVRNERFPELAIYSFDDGERFEPDFLIFARKKRSKGDLFYQGYVEPKGDHLLIEDAWKETFSLQIEEDFLTKEMFSDEYRMIGFPFFNVANRIDEFDKAINEWIERL